VRDERRGSAPSSRVDRPARRPKSAPAALIAALKDEDREVESRRRALGTSRRGRGAARPLTRDADVEVKRAAVEALSSIGGVRAIEVMAGLLKDDDPRFASSRRSARQKH
jgi:HEAT repeat protein